MNVSVSALAICLSLVLGSAYAQPDKPAGEQPKKSKQPKQAKQKGSASAGRSAPQREFVPDPQYDLSYRANDLDGDGQVSKAEAAGNETLILGFHRADRDRDGRLNRKEYEALFRAREKDEANSKPKTDKASAGASGRASR